MSEPTISLQHESFSVVATGPQGDKVIVHARVIDESLPVVGGCRWVLECRLPNDKHYSRRATFEDVQAAVEEAQRIAGHVLAAYLRTAEADENLAAVLHDFATVGVS